MGRKNFFKHKCILPINPSADGAAAKPQSAPEAGISESDALADGRRFPHGPVFFVRRIVRLGARFWTTGIELRRKRGPPSPYAAAEAGQPMLAKNSFGRALRGQLPKLKTTGVGAKRDYVGVSLSEHGQEQFEAPLAEKGGR